MELFLEYFAFITLAVLVLGVLGYGGWPRREKEDTAKQVGAATGTTSP